MNIHYWPQALRQRAAIYEQDYQDDQQEVALRVGAPKGMFSPGLLGSLLKTHLQISEVLAR